MIVVQIAQLIEYLCSYLREILQTKLRAQVSQMKQIFPALLIVLAYDVDIVMRVKYVYKHLDSLFIQTSQLLYLFRQYHDFRKLNLERLQVHLIILKIITVLVILLATSRFAEVSLKQAGVAVKN